MAQPSSNKKRLANAWNNYSRLSLDPINAHAIQRQETRRAFYVGAAALLDLIVQNMSPGEEPTPDDLAMMDDIKLEIDQFMLQLKAGRA